MTIKKGDDVTHNGYPIGTLTAIRRCIGNGQSFGLVQIHGHADDAPTPIPLEELRADVGRRCCFVTTETELPLDSGRRFYVVTTEAAL